MDPTGSDISQTAARPAIEVRRGFNAAMYATRSVNQVNTWAVNFEKALFVAREHHTNSAGFVLGMQFGFSYRVAEFEQSHQSLSYDQLRILVAEGTLARLEYEDCKRELGITDADVVQTLGISVSAFAAWKSSAETTDFDYSVVDPRKWLLL